MKQFIYKRSPQKYTEYSTIFDSISEITEYLDKAKPNHESKSSETGSTDFTMTTSLKDAITRFKSGDKELFETYKSQKDIVKVKSNLMGQTIARKSAINDFYGVVPNVPNYLIGVPKTMINYIDKKPKANILNIVIVPTANSNWEATDMLRVGITYLAVLEILERQGYRCNLWASIIAEMHDKSYTTMTTKIKSDKEQLNIKKCLFPIANPSYLRRIYFKYAECLPKEINIGGYGASISDKAKMEELIHPKIPNAIIWNYDTRNLSIKNVLDNLKQTGIKVETR